MTDNSTEYKKPWYRKIEIWVSTGVGIIVSFSISYYFFDIQKNKREPYFIVDPHRIEIIDSNNLEKWPIEVIRKKDKTPINGDISAFRFFFWNLGRRSIDGSYHTKNKDNKNKDILQNIQIAFTDDNVEILQQSTFIRENNKYVKPQLCECTQPQTEMRCIHLDPKRPKMHRNPIQIARARVGFHRTNHLYGAARRRDQTLRTYKRGKN